MARTELKQFEDVDVIVVERCDRARIDGELVRIHQEDTCQALGVHPGDKYQNDGGPSAADIVGLLRRVVNAGHEQTAVARFVDGLIWNWIVVGTDAHAKNYSLLLEGDQVRLAPLYDIGSILPYDHSHPRKWRWAMKHGGDDRVDTFRDPWPKMAVELGLEAEALRARVRELCDAAPDHFTDAMAALPEHARASTMPARLTDAVAERVVRLGQVLDGPPARVEDD